MVLFIFENVDYWTSFYGSSISRIDMCTLQIYFQEKFSKKGKILNFFL